MSFNEGGEHRDQEVRILDLGAVVLRRWRLVAGTTLAVLLLAVTAALLRPMMYTATVVMLPPQEQGGGRADAIARQLAGAGIPGAGAVGSPNQRLIGALARSRSLSDSLVARVVGPDGDREAAAQIREILGRYTELESKPDGSLAVEVSGRDPRLAARVANAFPPLINALSVRVGVEAAVQKQQFLEAQLSRARESLERSEERLVTFQKRRNAPELQEQARRTVEAAAELQRQITAQELRVNQLLRTSTPDNPQLRAAQADLSALRGQLRRLTGGGAGPLFIPFQESPDLAATITRLQREYAKDEKVYLSLTAALAEAQIEVNNNLPVVSVLDAATVPSAPSGTSLKVILAVAGMLGLVLGLIAAFVAEHFARARHDPDGGLFFQAWEQFKGDLRRGGFRRRDTGVRAPVSG